MAYNPLPLAGRHTSGHSIPGSCLMCIPRAAAAACMASCCKALQNKLYIWPLLRLGCPVQSTAKKVSSTHSICIMISWPSLPYSLWVTFHSFFACLSFADLLAGRNMQLGHDTTCRIDVGSESGVDRSKSLKSYLCQHFAEDGNNSIEVGCRDAPS